MNQWMLSLRNVFMFTVSDCIAVLWLGKAAHSESRRQRNCVGADYIPWMLEGSSYEANIGGSFDWIRQQRIEISTGSAVSYLLQHHERLLEEGICVTAREDLQEYMAVNQYSVSRKRHLREKKVSFANLYALLFAACALEPLWLCSCACKHGSRISLACST